MILVLDIYAKPLIIEIPSQSSVEILSVNKGNVLLFFLLHGQNYTENDEKSTQYLTRERE